MASTGSSSSATEPHLVTAPAHATVVVALTSYNDAHTIADVARSVHTGVTRMFGEGGAAILLADAHSTDGTREAALAAVGPRTLVAIETPAPASLTELPYHGHPGRAL